MIVVTPDGALVAATTAVCIIPCEAEDDGQGQVGGGGGSSSRLQQLLVGVVGGFGMGTGEGYSPVAFNYLIIGAERSFVFVVRSFTVANWDALGVGVRMTQKRFCLTVRVAWQRK